MADTCAKAASLEISVSSKYDYRESRRIHHGRHLDHERFLNLHGERGVRLDLAQSIHYSQHRRKKWVRRADLVDGSNGKSPWYQRFIPAVFCSKSVEDDDEMICVDADPEPSLLAKKRHHGSLFMYAATIAMFGGPLVHANRLREISLDQIVHKKLLAKYTEKMVAEWRDVALYVSPAL